MSRGFVKESDQEDLPMVPPRADLPAGTVNYVTAAGYAELLAERDQLLHDRDGLSVSDGKIAFTSLIAKIYGQKSGRNCETETGKRGEGV